MLNKIIAVVISTLLSSLVIVAGIVTVDMNEFIVGLGLAIETIIMNIFLFMKK